MSAVWVVVVLVGAATVALKAVGPVVLGGRELPRPLSAVLFLLAPALLGALVVTQAVGDREPVLDERLLGLGAAGVALALRAPLLVVVVIAAAVTAGARALG